jgi:hypothetical protein
MGIFVRGVSGPPDGMSELTDERANKGEEIEAELLDRWHSNFSAPGVLLFRPSHHSEPDVAVFTNYNVRGEWVMENRPPEGLDPG